MRTSRHFDELDPAKVSYKPFTSQGSFTEKKERSHVLHKKVLMPCDKKVIKVTRGFLSENLEKFSLSLTESWLILEST